MAVLDSRHNLLPAQPVVSVIIPTYNCAAYLAQAIESVLIQSVKPVQIIVIDDASQDSTQQVAARFARRICYLRNESNSGVSFSRNRGLAMATGRYVAFLDADDFLLPDKVGPQVQFLDRYLNFGVVYSDTMFCNQTGETLEGQFSQLRRPHSGNVLEALCRENFFPIHAALVRRECLVAAGYFEEYFRPNEDWHFWLRLAALTPFHYEDRVGCMYRVHGHNVTHNRLAMSRANARVRLWLMQSPLFSTVSRSTRSYNYLSCGVSLAKSDHAAQARRLFAQSIRLEPWHPLAYALWLLSLTGSAMFARLENALKAAWLWLTRRNRSPLPL